MQPSLKGAASWAGLEPHSQVDINHGSDQDEPLPRVVTDESDEVTLEHARKAAIRRKWRAKKGQELAALAVDQHSLVACHKAGKRDKPLPPTVVVESDELLSSVLVSLLQSESHERRRGRMMSTLRWTSNM